MSQRRGVPADVADETDPMQDVGNLDRHVLRRRQFIVGKEIVGPSAFGSVVNEGRRPPGRHR